MRLIFCQINWSNFVGHPLHKMPHVNKEVMFQHVYGNLPTLVFYRVGVLRQRIARRALQLLFPGSA